MATIHAEKLFLKFLQIFMVMSLVHSGNIGDVERPIEKDVEDYLAKLNSTDETISHFKKYLDVVEGIKEEFSKNKEFDKDTVLKLLESVDFSLLDNFDFSKFDEETRPAFDTVARNIRRFTKNTARSFLSSDENEHEAGAEELEEFMRNEKEFMRNEKEFFDEDLHEVEEFYDEIREDTQDKNVKEFLNWLKESVKHTFKPEEKKSAEIFKIFQNFTGIYQKNYDNPLENLKKPSLHNKADISSAISHTKEIESSESKKVEETTLNKFRHYTSFPKNIHQVLIDDTLDNVKNNLTEVIMKTSSELNSLEQNVNTFVSYFNAQNIFRYGIESLYDTRDIIEIAFTIKRQIIDHKNFLSIAMSENMKKLLSVFPKCLQKLMTSNSVCFFNREYANILYAPSGPIFYHDDERRYIFGWEGPSSPIRTDFIVEYVRADEFRFKNRAYNEYMFASKIRFVKDRRLVMQWLAGTAVDGSVWRLEFDNNYCSLFNTEYKEYLCLDDIKKDPDRRFVFTCAHNNSGKSQFRFISCD